jgi:hypothetical protein
MDRKLNVIHRKISRLRADMLVLQQHIRVQVNYDLDCSASSLRLVAMRTQMVDLIAQRTALGGEASPDSAARLRQAYRPELRRRAVLTEKPGRSRALSA